MVFSVAFKTTNLAAEKQAIEYQLLTATSDLNDFAVSTILEASFLVFSTQFVFVSKSEFSTWKPELKLKKEEIRNENFDSSLWFLYIHFFVLLEVKMYEIICKIP